MLSSTLFSRFPTIAYNGQIVTNITARVKFQKLAEDNMIVFYPYTMTEGERADVIAYNYYGDASYTWLIYLANGIQDPLNDWHKTEDQLKRFLAHKYGSLTNAIEKTLFYRVEWADDDSMLSAAAYQALPIALRKYWSPEYNDQRRVVRYVRSQDDWVIDTNKILKLSMDLQGDAPAVGSYVHQLSGGVKSATGEVSLVEGSTLYVKHVVGEFIGSPASPKTTYIGETTVGTCTGVILHSSPFTEPVYSEDLTTVLKIPPMWLSEQNYWVPVSAYDYETELNESKKTIQLIDPSYLDTIERDLRLSFA